MPTKRRQESRIIELFVSEYGHGAWQNAALTFPDEENDGAIDAFVTRADQLTLAIEHTVIEPFVGDIQDQAEFIPEFLSIEQDESLHAQDRWIRLFVPVGTLHLRKRPIRDAILRSVAEWLRTNGQDLPLGDSEHMCPIRGISSKPDFSIMLTLKTAELAGKSVLHVRRQQIDNTLGEVVERSLARKLPKLVDTPADRRVLLLERRHANLLPEDIYREVESRRSMFPELAGVHEIWVVEKIPFFQEGNGVARFELWENAQLRQTFSFHDGRLFETSSEDGRLSLASMVTSSPV